MQRKKDIDNKQNLQLNSIQMIGFIAKKYLSSEIIKENNTQRCLVHLRTR